MKSRKKQLGFWGAVVGGALGLLGTKMSNDKSEANTAASYENTRMLRQTAYQDTTQDLKAAGLNPMLAYQNSATAATPSPVAQNRNLMEGVVNSAMAVEQVKNVKEQNELLRAQTAKTNAEALAVPITMANTEATTENLKATLPKIIEEARAAKFDTLTAEERTALTRQQNRLVQIQQDLNKGQLSNIEAQTRTQNILTELRKLEIPGLENIAQWERSFGQYSKEAGAVGKAAGVLSTITNSARKVFGK